MPDICDQTIAYLADQLASVTAELAEERRLRLGAEQAAATANVALRYYKSHLALVIAGGVHADKT